MNSNLPPGVTDGMLPGNRAEDAEWELLMEDVADVLANAGFKASEEQIELIGKHWADKLALAETRSHTMGRHEAEQDHSQLWHGRADGMVRYDQLPEWFKEQMREEVKDEIISALPTPSVITKKKLNKRLDEAARKKVESADAYTIFDLFCQWNGIVNFTQKLLNAIQAIEQGAKVTFRPNQYDAWFASLPEE
jgi:hypothetical protein